MDSPSGMLARTRYLTTWSMATRAATSTAYSMKRLLWKLESFYFITVPAVWQLEYACPAGGARLFGGNPSFFSKRKRGERKRRRGNEDASPSGPPSQCIPGG